MSKWITMCKISGVPLELLNTHMLTHTEEAESQTVSKWTAAVNLIKSDAR